MILNPFILLLALYFTSNLLSALLGVSMGGMELENYYFDILWTSFVSSFFMQVFFLAIFFLLYHKFNPISNLKVLMLGWRWGFVLIFIQVSYIVFNLIMEVNVAGSSKRLSGGSFLNYIFVLLQPDILFVVTSVLLVNSRLFWINVFIFIISFFLRGWMGGVFIGMIVVLIRYYPIKLSFVKAVYCSFLLIVIMALLPMLYDAKWAFRSNVSFDEFLHSIPESFTVEKYQNSLGYLLNRFQHVGHGAIIFESANELHQNYDEGHFSSYWEDGLPQAFYHKLSVDETKKYSLNFFLVSYFWGVENPTWNTNPGLTGWVFILNEYNVFLLLYIILFIVVPQYYISKYGGKKISLVLSSFALVYLFHGWFGAYLNLMLYMVVIVTLLRTRVKTIQNSNGRCL
ncbi:MAG: hypothetical protein ACI8SR_001291 [Oceanicoccus sp.]|jgi:hypothetical protein